MMKKFALIQNLVMVSGLWLGSAGHALASIHVYPSDAKVATQIGSDLYESLDAKYRAKLEAHPIRPVDVQTPSVTLVQTNDQNKTLSEVTISTGFVELINHIAHAKAIDHIEPGYFAKYMSTLGSATTAPEITGEQYWKDEVLNDQAGYFNQIMGMTMAITLSHHYLGQFDKHASQLGATPINNVLSTDEWEKGVRAGAVNSLNCAYGTDGAKSLFDAIGKMTQRPAWTAYIVPQNVDIQRLNKQLAKYEVDFFHGGLN